MIYIIAFITMFIDHLGSIFFPHYQIFRIIGRLSFPLFAFGIAKGFICTSNFKRYAARLSALAVMSQLPYFLLFHNGYLNICFTLLSGLMFLKFYKSNYSIYLKFPLLLIFSIAPQILKFEYGIYGVLTILIFYIFYNSDNAVYFQLLLTLAAIIIFKYDPMQLFSILSCFIILFLRNDNKRVNRYLRYSFYPLHILIFYFIKMGGLLK